MRSCAVLSIMAHGQRGLHPCKVLLLLPSYSIITASPRSAVAWSLRHGILILLIGSPVFSKCIPPQSFWVMRADKYLHPKSLVIWSFPSCQSWILKIALYFNTKPPASSLAYCKAFSLGCMGSWQFWGKNKWTALQFSFDGPDLHWCVGPEPRWIQAPVGRSRRLIWGWTPPPPLQPPLAVGAGWGALCFQKASLSQHQSEKEAGFHQATFYHVQWQTRI